MGAVDLVIQIESPAQRGQRAAAGRPRRPPGRRGQPRRAVPQAPRRPRPDRGRRPADAHRRHRVARGSRPTRSTCSPSRSSPPPPSTPGTSTTSTTWCKRTRRFAQLPRSAYDATLDLLSGRYPTDEFAELRPRIVWDRVTGTLTGRPGAQRLAVTSGGTIPDRGLFGVFLVGGEGARAGGSASSTRRWSTSPGSATSSRSAPPAGGSRTSPTTGCWSPRRPASPAGCRSGRATPSAARPSSGQAIGAFTRELARAAQAEGRGSAPASDGLDEYAAGNLVGYLHEQLEATQVLPSDPTLLVERFRDELGDWRLVVHSPYGTPVHAPWALAINARLRERYGVDGQAVASDDGIVIRIPDTDAEPPGGEVVVFEPDEIDDLVTQEVGGSALFASRFRECAARALLLPRRDPGRRSPAVAAAPALGRAARGRLQVPVVPDRPRGRPRVPPGRLRPARPGRADARGRPARGPGHRRRDARARRRTPAACCSATSPSSSTRATPPSPSAGPPRSRSTRGCSPSCSAGPSCASCSTPRCWPRSRPSCSGSPPTAGPATPRASPTCSGCSARSPPTRSRPGAPTASTPTDALAALAATRRVGRGPDGRRGALGRDRGRRPAARRARRGRAARHPRRVHRPRRRPAGRPGLPLRPHPRPVHHRRRRRPARARRRRRPPHPAAARPPRAGCSTASSGPAASGLGVVRRRGAPLAAPPLAGPAAQGGRAGRAGGARPVPRAPGSTSAASSAASTACCR